MKSKRSICTLLMVFLLLLTFGAVNILAADATADYMPLSEDDMEFYMATGVNNAGHDLEYKDDILILTNNIDETRTGYVDVAYNTGGTEFDATKKIIFEYDFEVVSGKGQIAFHGLGFEWKLGQVIPERMETGYTDLPKGVYKGSVVLSDEVKDLFVEEGILYIDQMNLFAMEESVINFKTIRVYEEGASFEATPTPTSTVLKATAPPTTVPPTKNAVTPTLNKPSSTAPASTNEGSSDINDDGKAVQPWVIIVIAVAAAAVIGGITFVIVKKKKSK